MAGTVDGPLSTNSPLSTSKAIRELLDREFPVLSSHLDTELSKAGLEDDLKAGIVLTV